jgi:hypothetical protein
VAAPSCYLVGSLQPVRCLLRVAIVSTRQISGSICCSCGSETFLCRSGVFALDVLFSSSYGAASSPAAVVRPVSCPAANG